MNHPAPRSTVRGFLLHLDLLRTLMTIGCFRRFGGSLTLACSLRKPILRSGGAGGQSQVNPGWGLRRMPTGAFACTDTIPGGPVL